jgi:hypothetical protein
MKIMCCRDGASGGRDGLWGETMGVRRALGGSMKLFVESR